MATTDSLYSTKIEVGAFNTSDKWAACPLSTLEDALNNSAYVPANATVTKVVLHVTASWWCGGGASSNGYIRYGIGGTSSISKELVAKTSILGGANEDNVYEYPSGGYDITTLLNTKVAPNVKFKTDNGSYLTFCFMSANNLKKRFHIKSVTLDITYHTHSYTPTVTTQPTCTEPGVRTYTCSCGNISHTESIPALGHSWNIDEYIWTEDTLGRWYCMAVIDCNRSGCTAQDGVMANVTSTVKIPATCTEMGTTSYTATFDVDGATTQVKDVQDIPAKGHTWVDATCTAPKTCSVCGATEGSALGHNYVSTVVQPTEDSHGYTRHTCTRCGHYYDDSYTYLVRWYNEDGSKLLETDPSVPYGTMPEYNGTTPTKAATAQYAFEHFGWNISPSADGKIDLTPVIANVKYYARFKSSTIWYQVDWLNEDGTVLQGADWTPYGNQPSYDGPPPTKPDSSDGKYRYEFLGWSVKDVDDGHYDESDLEPVTGHITYEAVYLPIVKQYNLYIEAYDGTVEGAVSGTYDYGTEFTIKVTPDFGYELGRIINATNNVSYTGDELTFILTGDLTLVCFCQRALAPIFISPEQQVQMVYIVPAINTIVYQVEGDLPTLETKMQSVDDFSFDVINTDIDEKYGLYAYYEVEQLYINKENQPAERVW